MQAHAVDARAALALQDLEVKPATIRLHLAILRRVLGLLEREGKIPKNPARGIGELLRRVDRSLASETEEVEHWARGEARALIRLAREHEPRLAPLLALLFATGLRRGEASASTGPKWTWTPGSSRRAARSRRRA